MDDVETVRQYTRSYPNGNVENVVILRVPESEKFPEGVKYRMHYGTPDGETILRYDNSHGVHERHDGEDVEMIEYPGIAELYRRFVAELPTERL
jgi:hypothetical protein